MNTRFAQRPLRIKNGFFGAGLAQYVSANFTDIEASHTPIPILKLHALHKQYTDYPTLSSKYEIVSWYKNVLFIGNIQ